MLRPYRDYVPPVDHELNLTMQAILTYGSWGLTAVILVIAIWMGMRERTPFYAPLVLAALVGAFAEPLYDVAMMLYFYSTEGMFTHFTAFDIPQPIWTHSGYVVLYAAPAIYITHQIARGTMTRRKLFVWAGITLLESAAFEIDRHQWRPLQLLGATRVPDLPVPVGDWCARSRSGDLLRGGGIAAACPLHRSVATAGSVRPVSVHILWGQLRRGLAHHHRDPPRAHARPLWSRRQR